MNLFFIIYISTRLSQFQFPRIADFSYNKEFDKYLYKGRPLTLEEFNAGSKVVFAESFRNEGFLFCPQAIEAKALTEEEIEAERVAAEEKAAAEALAAKEAEEKAAAEALLAEQNTSEPDTSEPDLNEAPVPQENSEPTAPFELRGKMIFVGDLKVAGIYGESKDLRVFEEEYRESVAAWLAENPA